VENVDILSFLLNFLFTSFDAPKTWSFEFRTIGMGTSPKSPVLDSTTVIDGQVKGSGLRIVFLNLNLNLNLNPNLWIMLLF
jgi:hypothetical protein